MRGRKVSVSMLVSMLVGLLVVTAPTPATALHWSGNGELDPYDVYQGVDTLFTFRLVNEAVGSLDVVWVQAIFCWNPPGFVYYLKPDDGDLVSIPGGDFYDFQALITVDPATLGPCPVDIYVYGAALGDTFVDVASYSDIVNVQVISGLSVTATGNPTSGVAPLDVSFTSTVSGGLSPYTYSWTFGDGDSSSAQNPSHTYQTAGSYTAALEVQDSLGAVASATVSVNVLGSLSATLGSSVTSGAVPLAVSFSVTASGGTPPYTYSWSFGDGGSSTQQNPSHTYQAAGTYTVSVIVTDAGSRSTTKTTTITVSPAEGLPGWIWILIAIIAIVAVAAVAAVLMRRRGARMPPAQPPQQPPQPPQYPQQPPQYPQYPQQPPQQPPQPPQGPPP